MEKSGFGVELENQGFKMRPKQKMYNFIFISKIPLKVHLLRKMSHHQATTLHVFW